MAHKYCLLKFIIFDFKEAKLTFKPSNNYTRISIDLPQGEYDVSEVAGDEEVTKTQDEYLITQSERCVVLKFSWNSDENESISLVILNFKVCAEYTRLDTKEIEYELEIKLS